MKPSGVPEADIYIYDGYGEHFCLSRASTNQQFATAEKLIAELKASRLMLAKRKENGVIFWETMQLWHKLETISKDRDDDRRHKAAKLLDRVRNRAISHAAKF
jgi:hypothetical protein